MSLKEDVAISIADIAPGMPPSGVSAASSAPPREARALLTQRLFDGGAVAAVPKGPMLADAPADVAMHTQASAAFMRLLLPLLPRLFSRAPGIIMCG